MFRKIRSAASSAATAAAAAATSAASAAAHATTAAAHATTAAAGKAVKAVLGPDLAPCEPPRGLVVEDRSSDTIFIRWFPPTPPPVAAPQSESKAGGGAPPIPPRRGSRSGSTADDSAGAGARSEAAEDGSGSFEYRVAYSGTSGQEKQDKLGFAKRSWTYLAESAERAYDHGSVEAPQDADTLTLTHLRSETRYDITVSARWVPRARHGADEIAAARARDKALTMEIQKLAQVIAAAEASEAVEAAARATQEAADAAADAAAVVVTEGGEADEGDDEKESGDGGAGGEDGATTDTAGAGSGAGAGAAASPAADEEEMSGAAMLRAHKKRLEEEQAALRAGPLARAPLPSAWSDPKKCRAVAVWTLSRDESELREHNERVELYITPDAPAPFPRFPVIYARDTGLDKAARVTSLSLEALHKSGVAQLMGIDMIMSSARVAKTVGKYGLAAAFFHNDITVAMAVLLKLTSVASMGLNNNPKNLSVGLYYLLWLHAEERLFDPSGELRAHQPGAPGVIEDKAPAELVQAFIDHYPFAEWPYRSRRDAIEWVASPAGFDLVCSSPSSRISKFWPDSRTVAVVSPAAPRDRSAKSEEAAKAAEERDRHYAFKPGFHMLANRSTRTAVISIRGTDSFTDALQDVQADVAPIEYCGEQYWCHGEMDKAGRWIATEGGVASWVAKFKAASAAQGARPWKFVLTGHSLGAAVATLLAIELVRIDPELKLDVYCYEPPAAVDAELSQALLPTAPGPVSVYSLVNRDDVVSRASAFNARLLLRKLDAVDWGSLISDDVQALEVRAKELWRPRHRRESLDMGKGEEEDDDGAEEGKGGADADAPDQPPQLERLSSFEKTQSCLHVAVQRAVGLPDTSTKLLGRTIVAMKPYVQVSFGLNPTPKSTRPTNVTETCASWKTTRRSRMQFWFSSRRLLEGKDGMVLTVRVKNKSRTSVTDPVLCVGTVSVAELLSARSTEEQAIRVVLYKNGGTGADKGARMGTVHMSVQGEFDVLDAGHQKLSVDAVRAGGLVRMAVPGTVVHLYKHNGNTLASQVTWDHPSLARLELQPNCLEDHLFKNVAKGLRDVVAARDPRCQPAPQWAELPDGLGSTTLTRVACGVCQYSTDWVAVAGSQAEVVRVTHHCYGCGRFVCEKCSTHRLTLPAIGIMQKRRVCDRCIAGLPSHALTVGPSFQKFAGVAVAPASDASSDE